MSFLMGLNDSFAQVRGQLLLMDPLPPINKVFSLISQEEHQRKIGSQAASVNDSNNTMAFVVQREAASRSGTGPNTHPGNKNQKKERPFCTHCNYHGHTVEKCYKIHGYPPGFRQKNKNQPFNNSNIVANQVTTQNFTTDSADRDNGTMGTFLQNLNSAQYQ